MSVLMEKCSLWSKEYRVSAHQSGDAPLFFKMLQSRWAALKHGQDSA